MTLSDVIDTLQTWIRNADDEYDREEMGRVAGLKEALHEIKKIEPCEDAISRQAVLDAMYNLCNTGENLQENPWRDNPHIDAITDAIEDLPSITPQPKTGYWTRELIRNEKGGCIGAKRICSRCGKDNKHDEYMDYCPNCGAEMFKSQESE